MSDITNRTATRRYATCDCGKRAFHDKRDAKALSRQLHDGLRVYRCDLTGAWHVGHPRQGWTREDYRRWA